MLPCSVTGRQRAQTASLFVYEDFMPDIQSDIVALTKALEKISPPFPNVMWEKDKKERRKPLVLSQLLQLTLLQRKK